MQHPISNRAVGTFLLTSKRRSEMTLSSFVRGRSVAASNLYATQVSPQRSSLLNSARPRLIVVLWALPYLSFPSLVATSSAALPTPFLMLMRSEF